MLTAKHDEGRWSLIASTLPRTVAGVVLEYARDINRDYFAEMIQCKWPLDQSTGDDATDLHIDAVYMRGPNSYLYCIPRGDAFETWFVYWLTDTTVLKCAAFYSSEPANLSDRGTAYRATMRCGITHWWNFVSGDACPQLRYHVDSCHTLGDNPDAIVAAIRRVAQIKIARWCSARECAALARVKFRVDN
jgi:hypothetical protein